MRRSIKPDLETSRAINTFQHRTSGTLPLRARDMNKTKMFLRIPSAFSQIKSRLKTGLRPEHSQLVQEVDGLGVSHTSSAVGPSESAASLPSEPFTTVGDESHDGTL